MSKCRAMSLGTFPSNMQTCPGTFTAEILRAFHFFLFASTDFLIQKKLIENCLLLLTFASKFVDEFALPEKHDALLLRIRSFLRFTKQNMRSRCPKAETQGTRQLRKWRTALTILAAKTSPVPVFSTIGKKTMSKDMAFHRITASSLTFVDLAERTAANSLDDLVSTVQYLCAVIYQLIIEHFPGQQNR